VQKEYGYYQQHSDKQTDNTLGPKRKQTEEDDLPQGSVMAPLLRLG